MKIEENSLIYRAAMFGYDDAPKNGRDFTCRLLLLAVVYGPAAAVVTLALLFLHGQFWNLLLGLGLEVKLNSDTDLTSNLACFGLGVLFAMIEIPLILGMDRGLRLFCGSIKLPDGDGEPEDKAAT